MPNSKVSVIIPVYNSEKSLEKCVRSVLQQTFQDFEIVLVDDGSRDRSAAICDDFVAKHPNVRVIHQKNAGASIARNKGIDAATGRFVTFVDSDDYIKPGYLQAFFELDDEPVKAIVIQGLIRIMKNGSRKVFNFPNKVYPKSYFSEAYKDMQLIGYPFVCSKLYDIEILNKYKIRFINDLVYAEDMVFYLSYLGYVNRIIGINKRLYIYNYSESSLAYTFSSFEIEFKTYSCIRERIDYIKERFLLGKKTPYFHNNSIGKYYYRAIFSLFMKKNRLNRKQQIEKLTNIIRPHFLLFLNNERNNYTKNQKIINFLLRRKYFTLLRLYVGLWIKRNQMKRLIQ